MPQSQTLCDYEIWNKEKSYDGAGMPNTTESIVTSVSSWDIYSFMNPRTIKINIISLTKNPSTGLQVIPGKCMYTA